MKRYLSMLIARSAEKGSQVNVFSTLVQVDAHKNNSYIIALVANCHVSITIRFSLQYQNHH